MKFYFILFILLYSINSFSQVYIKDYIYKASENDSKSDARNYALLKLKKLSIEESGVLVLTRTNLNKNDIDIKLDQNTIIISEAITKTTILEENWNGYEYYIKAKIYIDKENLIKRLNNIDYGIIENKEYVINNKNIVDNNEDDYEDDFFINIFSSYQPNLNYNFIGLTFGFISKNIYNIGFYTTVNINDLSKFKYTNNGILIGLVFNNKNKINYIIPLKIGYGYLSTLYNQETFTIIEPSLNISLNLKNFKITTGMGYKFIQNLNDNYLNGYNIYLKIGI